MQRDDLTLDPVAAEVEQWRRFVQLFVLLVQSGRLDAVDGAELAEALGHPPDVGRGRSALFAIARRHEAEACADAVSGPA